ncbi:MAG: hypothetical protein EA385_02110 [Salinarimonadaceae bacterium]|nr:MAG: hypothetical protein EA385_02110 [Salinarimonadaceae bacterium]
MKITVAGGGNSAQTMAADLALLGHDVTLFDLPEYASSIAAAMSSFTLEKYGSIDTRGPTGLARLANVTTDLGEAIDGAEAIFIAVPAYAHPTFFEAIGPHLRPGQIVAIMPGNWGAYRLRRHLLSRGLGEGVYVAETDLCMHICRAAEPFLGPGKVRVVLERGAVRLAAVPRADTAHVMERLSPVYPVLQAAGSVLETSINNSNIIAHGPLVLMNAGWLEHTGGDFMIYRDGVTPSVGRVTDAIAKERDAVAHLFGFPILSTRNTYEDTRNARWVLDPCEIGPPDLKHRYISEDIPFGLVPLSSIASTLGLQLPVTNAMIEISNVSNEVDYWADGLTIETLGLPRGGSAEILEAVADLGGAPK